MENNNHLRPGLDVAVIGMACRFPGANNIDEFYANLKNGVESIETLSDDILKDMGVSAENINDPNFVKVRCSMENPDCFDAEFFGYTDQEASTMDPQMRVLHECTWEAMENAGYISDHYKGNIGLYVGGTANPIWETMTVMDQEEGIWGAFNRGDLSNAFAKTLLHDKDLMSTRVAYKMNFKGPVITNFSSCSTSLVSIHLAVQAILCGECDMAVAGGVSVSYPERKGYLFHNEMIVSPDGHCRSFDNEAAGTVFGDGIGLVVLKRLEDAMKDGDQIQAVIRGSAINNDGSEKIGFTAPSVEGQLKVIRYAMQAAEVEPESIHYIEGHGSATKLGDSIELEAMKRAYSDVDKNRIAIGSVKTNIGHLNSAAGVAGFIKTVLLLKNRELFPSLHYHSPNPEVIDSPFFVNRELAPFNYEYPVRAGVSAFGVGGTNAHIILEEPPNQFSTKTEEFESQLFVLSAKSESALKKKSENLLAFLKENQVASLADIAYTLKIGRKPFSYRKAIICENRENAIQRLENFIQNYTEGRSQKSVTRGHQTVFMFPGLGAQYMDMGRWLYQSSDYFHALIDKCFSTLQRHDPLGKEVKEYLYPLHMNKESVEDRTKTDMAQPITFIFEYAFAKQLLYWGIKPDILIGYSLGEITAACLAEIISLEDAIKLIMTRTRLMNQIEDAMLLSVPLPKIKTMPFLNRNLSLAIDNGQSCVISGSKEEISSLEEVMRENRIMCMALKSQHAAHSHLLDEILDDYRKELTGIVFHAPKYPIVSNVTGTLVTDDEMQFPEYWVKQMRNTVQFADGVKEIAGMSSATFLEVGPGRDMSLLVRSITSNLEKPEPGRKYDVVDLISTENRIVPEHTFLLNRLGQLFEKGFSIDWDLFYEGKVRRRVTLPSYPFHSKSYWPSQDQQRKVLNGCTTITKKHLDEKRDNKDNIDNWFYIPVWKRLPHGDLNNDELGKKNIMIFQTPDWGPGQQLVKELEATSGHVIQVWNSGKYQQINSARFMINQDDLGSYRHLFRALAEKGTKPDKIIHLWTLPEAEESEVPADLRFEEAQKIGLYSLLHIIEAYNEFFAGRETDITVVTRDAVSVTGEEELRPEYTTLFSTAKIISQEYINIHCSCIDYSAAHFSQQQSLFVESLLGELEIPIRELTVSYRGKSRWVEDYEQFPVKKKKQLDLLHKDKVYLITGGLGNIGFHLALHLVTAYGSRVALVNRTAMPPKEEWSIILADENHPDHKRVSRWKVLLEAAGDGVAYYAVDVADMVKMRSVAEDIEARFGQLNGIIHTAGSVRENAKALSELEIHDFQNQFHGKVYGLLVLDQLFGHKELDFCLFTSSLTSILGGLGDAAYGAANSFLDGFAQKCSNEGRKRWMSINWETWLFEDEKISDTNVGNSRLAHAMSIDEGINSYQILQSLTGTSQVVVSSSNLEVRRNQWLYAGRSANEENEKQSKEEAIKDRPELLSIYVEPNNKMERMLAEYWQDFFRIRRVGVRDDFFELGGDSFKAIQMIAKIQKNTGVYLSVAEFFENSTIEQIELLLRSKEKSGELHRLGESAVQKEYYKASPAQKRIYILNQMNQDSTAYNEPIVATITGEINKHKVELIFEKIIARHESLRTGFLFNNGDVYQKILEPQEVKVAVDWYEAKEENVAEVVHGLIRPFDLGSPPLIQVGMIRIDQLKHIIVINIHHIITDGVSEELLIREFVHLYKDEPLAELTMQYKDYSEWMISFAESPEWNKQKAYWLNRYSTIPPVVHLPYDRVRAEEQDFSGDSYCFSIEPELASALSKFCSQFNVTVYIALFSVFSVLLSRLSQEEDIVVGTAISGRTTEESNSVIGMFVNTLAIRSFPESNKTYAAFLQQFKTDVIQAYDNQLYPFEELINTLSVNRTKGQNPLFNVSFIWQNEKRRETQVSDSTLATYDYKKTSSKFDLSLIGQESEDGEIVFNMEYATSIFNPDTIIRFCDYFKKILKTVITDQGITLSEIDLLPAKERETVLYTFNQTEVAYDLHQSLGGHFEENVRRFPDKVALNWDGGKICYRELNKLVNKVAHELIRHDIKPNEVVPIIVDRQLEMMLGIWGILKSGAAYLPIDPRTPDDRIRFMLQDCNAKLVLTGGNVNIKLPESVMAIQLEDFSDTELSTENPAVISLPEDAAYVIYTSGSTGTPKGVIVQRNSLMNRLLWMEKNCGFSEADVVLQKTTYTFDVSVWEIVLPLVVGASIYLVKPEGEKEPDYLADIICKQGISTVHFVPSMLSLFLKRVSSEITSSKLRICICSGEALTAQITDQFFHTMGHNVMLYNLYGPTEAAIDVTMHQVLQEDSMISIGKPVANTMIYILDEQLRPVPIGISGEIYISGIQVARGYVNNPELTSKRFLTDPYHIGNTMYSTGDVGKWRSDGSLEYLGRNDNQIKLRGFRIELGEVESIMRKHPKVLEAVAAVVSADTMDNQLVAYLKVDGAVTVKELKTFLRTYCPEYMIPTHIYQIDELPYTTSGKLDRKRIAAHSHALDEGVQFIKPQNMWEQRLSALWSEIIGTSQFGVSDNFFDAGGNSINLIHLRDRIKTAYELDIPATALFRYTTIRDLSEYILQNYNNEPQDTNKEDWFEQSAEKAKQRRKNRRDKQQVFGDMDADKSDEEVL